jgi:hypothetical protein
LVDLVGTWTLRRATATAADGTVRYPFGLEPRGLLLYTAGGWMSATITSVGAGAGSPGPVIYAGRVTVRDDEVIHSVVAGMPPFRPGSAQRRGARLEAPGVLVLTTPPGEVTGQAIALRWRRIE